MPNLVKCSLTGFKCKPSGRYSSVLDCACKVVRFGKVLTKNMNKDSAALSLAGSSGYDHSGRQESLLIPKIKFFINADI